MPALCWHTTPAYYAFYYAGIFDAGIALTGLSSPGSSFRLNNIMEYHI